MCEPISIMAGVGLLGGGMQAYGQRQAGKANQAIAHRNARMSMKKAKDSEDRGKIDANRRRQQGVYEAGSQRAAFAANGVVVDRDSAAEVVADTGYISELDALTIENNAAREAFGHRTNAANGQFEGDLARSRGNQQAASTILTSSANAYSQYKR